MDAALSHLWVNISWEGLASVNKKTELSCNSKHARTCYKQEDRKQKERD